MKRFTTILAALWLGLFSMLAQAVSVTAGSSASYTFGGGETVAISLDANEVAQAVVLSSAGAQRFGGTLRASQTIGPFNSGDVFSVTAVSGTIDYVINPFVPPSSTLTSVQANAGGMVIGPRIQKIRRAINAAKTLNDADASVVADSFTLTAPTTIDAGLTKTFQFSPTNDGRVFTLFGGVWTQVNVNPGYSPVVDTSAGTATGMVQAEWITDAPKLEVGSSAMATGAGLAGQLYVDGHPLQSGALVNSTSGGTRFFTLDWGGVRKIRSYRLVMASPGWLRALWVDTASTVRPTSRDDTYRCAVEGDSIPAGTMSEAYDTIVQTYTYISMSLLGCRDIWLGAHGGTGWTVVGSYNTLPQRQDWLVAANPDIVFFLAGRNDTGASAATVQAAAQGELIYLRPRLPGVPFIVGGAHAGNTAPDAATLATENAISAAVTAANDSFTTFMPISTAADPWMQTGNTTTYITSSGSNVHPNIAGSNYLARTQSRAAPATFPSLQGSSN